MIQALPSAADPALLRTILNFAACGVALYETLRDKQGNITDFRLLTMNQQAEHITGVDVQVQSGQMARELFTDTWQTDILQQMAQVVETGKEHRERVWFRATTTTPAGYYDLTIQSALNGVAISFVDVTAIEAERRMLAGIIEHTPNGLVVMEAIRNEQHVITDFRIRLVNSAIGRFSGLDAQTFQATLLEIDPSLAQNGLFARGVQVVETAQRFTAEYPFNDRHYAISVSKLDDGVIVSFTDITSQKQANRALDYQQSLLEGILNTSQSSITVFEAIRDNAGEIVDFRTVLANPAAYLISGKGPGEVIGKTLTELNPVTKTHGLWYRYIDVCNTQQPYRTEQYFQVLNRWFDVQVSPLGDGFVATYQDITDRKQAELAIQQQAELLEGVLTASPNSLSVYEAIRDHSDGTKSGQITDFRIVLTNEASLALIPRQLIPEPTRQHIEGQTHLTFFPHTIENGIFQQLVNVVETGELYRFAKDYPEYGVSLEYSITRFGDGLIMGVVDISNQKKTQFALQQTNALLRAVLDGAFAGVTAYRAVRDESGAITDFLFLSANQKAMEILGRPTEELVGKGMLQLYPTVKKMGVFDRYVAVAETGVIDHFVERYQGENLDIWFDVSAAKSGDGIVLTFLDVSDRKQAEQRLEQQANLVQGVLDSTLTAVAVYEPVNDENGQIVDFRFTLANQASFDVLGLTPEVLYTKTLCELNPSLRGSDAFSGYVDVVRTGKPYTTERQIRDRWFLVSAGRFDQRGLLTSSIDITEIKEARVQIEQMNIRLRHSNQSLDQFASVASHDLQEPLRKIRSFGDILADQYGPVLGDGVTLLRRMQSAAERMQTLIRDLLTYSRLSKGEEDSLHLLDLGRLVEEVLVDLEVSVQEKSAVIEVADLPKTVPGDELQLRQVFQNLLSNALKFSKPGEAPRIRVACERVTAAQLPTDSRPAGKPASFYWQITVTDNGIGFSNTYRERIFGAFERLHGKNSTYGGTGIGLAIVRKVMENHHGTVTAQSQEGEGSTFTLYLPIS